MQIGRKELRDQFVYQIGAVKAFLDAHGMRLNHLKPHGVIYSMSAADRELAEGMCDAAELFELTLFGIPASQMQAAAEHRGLPFAGEFFVDLEYDHDGRQINRKDRPIDTDWVSGRLRRALRDGRPKTSSGRLISIDFQAVCVHNDMPNAAAVAKAARAVLEEPQAQNH
jgi:UPF0271 protein